VGPPALRILGLERSISKSIVRTLMSMIRERAEEILRACPEWYHSIELAPGIVTPGRRSTDQIQQQLLAMRLPDLHGKSVLDIGAYDGAFSFAVERLGAARVTALDHYVWSTDMAGYMNDWRESNRTGAPLPAPHESRHWHPDELPGRRPFDSARELLDSKVEPVVGDFMTMDLADLGQFDVVLFMGVLYHMQEPLSAMKRVASLTAPGGLAVIETAAVELQLQGLEDRPFFEFLPGQESNNDPTNWWIPNAKAIEGLCSAAGFREATMITKAPMRRWYGRNAMKAFLSKTSIAKKLGVGEIEGFLRYRAIAHARP
jgi:tRNA (mo5U34)-methyltransferase